MKKAPGLLLLFLFNLNILTAIGQNKWVIDTNHSQLSFAIGLMNISDVEGSFKIKSATITSPTDDFSNAVLTMMAETKTIYTGVAQRDTHLRTADFFDADKYPLISFSSTSFKKTGDGKFTVTGDLTMHGITKPVTLYATANTLLHPVTKKTVAGFRVTGTIKRNDFNISAATPNDMLSNEVAIRANVQFEKQ